MSFHQIFSFGICNNTEGRHKAISASSHLFKERVGGWGGSVTGHKNMAVTQRPYSLLKSSAEMILGNTFNHLKSQTKMLTTSKRGVFLAFG